MNGNPRKSAPGGQRQGHGVTKIYLPDPLIRLEVLHQRRVGIAALVLSLVSLAVSTAAILLR